MSGGVLGQRPRETRVRLLARRLGVVVATCTFLAVLFGMSSEAIAQDETLVSTDGDGTPANAASYYPAISRWGYRVAFFSDATNLVFGDTNGLLDVFVKDLITGNTTRASVSSEGNQASGASVTGGSSPALSPEGRYVAFGSDAANLVPSDTNGHTDIFLHDLWSGETELVSTAWDGGPANGNSAQVAISYGGEFVVFRSDATNIIQGGNPSGCLFARDMDGGATRLIAPAATSPSVSDTSGLICFQSASSSLVQNDTNGCSDVFLYDWYSQTIERVSVSASATQANDASTLCMISGDGSHVAFYSQASNLISGDTNGCRDIFVKDLFTAAVERASITVDGDQLASSSDFDHLGISADGSYIAYTGKVAYMEPQAYPTYYIPAVYRYHGGETTRVSGIPSSGDQFWRPTLSGDGLTLAYDHIGAPYPYVCVRTAIMVGAVFGLDADCNLTNDPVNTSTGNCALDTTDLSLANVGPALALTRTYNSQDAQLGPLGYGWRHAYMTCLKFSPIFGCWDVTVVYPDGHQATYAWNDSEGTYEAPPGATERLVYDDENECVYQLIFPNQTVYTYEEGWAEEDGKLLGIADRFGNELALTYNGGNALAEAASDSGRALAFSYTDGLLTEVEDTAGRSVSFGYDDEDLVTATDSNGHTTTYAYDGNHQMVSLQQPETTEDPLVTNTYADGRVTCQVDALANDSHFSYDPNDRVTTITDNRGGTWVDSWDSRYRLVSHSDPDDGETVFSYGASGFMDTVTDANDNMWSHEYDSLGNVVSATDPKDHETTAEYDTDNGNLLWAEDALGNRAAYGWDQTGVYLDSIESPVGITYFDWNADGTLDTLTDANSHTWAHDYNASGDLISVVDPLYFETTYGYDAAGRVVSIEDPNSCLVEYVHDVKGNLTSIIDPLAEGDSQNRHQIDITYDGNDNAVEIEDANGNSTGPAPRMSTA
jgi:YD repeat-containing protein